MYSDKEKKLARALLEDKDLCVLLEKVFTTKDESFNHSVIADKTNEELGELVRADSLAEQKVLNRWRNLQLLGQPEPSESKNRKPLD